MLEEATSWLKVVPYKRPFIGHASDGGQSEGCFELVAAEASSGQQLSAFIPVVGTEASATESVGIFCALQQHGYKGHAKTAQAIIIRNGVDHIFITDSV